MARTLDRRASLVGAGAAALGALVGRAQGAHAADEPHDALALAARIQLFHDALHSYQAEFTHVAQLIVDRAPRVRRGRVAFEKPGKLSFRYAAPSRDRVVSDGKTVRAYLAEDKLLYVSKLALSPYPATLAFLAGQGVLTRDFELRTLPSQEALGRGDAVLEAVPREATPAFVRVLFLADLGSGGVRRVLVLDAQGNRNRFDFAAPTLDATIPAREFSLVPPPGTETVDL
ncbi:MAG: outer membrane lipoprotein carrier protein LolA [Polyangiaceae bacterium]|nr:outer membrane lipoprotein carrier protein LolA [Polyangiaceae bacterium]